MRSGLATNSHLCLHRPGRLDAPDSRTAYPRVAPVEGPARRAGAAARRRGRRYRAWAPGLRDGYPPLVRTGSLATYLGPPPFIGREELLAEVVGELRGRAVVSLLGPGGMGKTRLAMEVGARVEAEFPA